MLRFGPTAVFATRLKKSKVHREQCVPWCLAANYIRDEEGTISYRRPLPPALRLPSCRAADWLPASTWDHRSCHGLRARDDVGHTVRSFLCCSTSEGRLTPPQSCRRCLATMPSSPGDNGPLQCRMLGQQGARARWRPCQLIDCPPVRPRPLLWLPSPPNFTRLRNLARSSDPSVEHCRQTR